MNELIYQLGSFTLYVVIPATILYYVSKYYEEKKKLEKMEMLERLRNGRK